MVCCGDNLLKGEDMDWKDALAGLQGEIAAGSDKEACMEQSIADGWASTAEMCEHIGRSRNFICNMMNAAIENGSWEREQHYRINQSGVYRLVPVYRPLKGKK